MEAEHYMCRKWVTDRLARFYRFPIATDRRWPATGPNLKHPLRVPPSVFAVLPQERQPPFFSCCLTPRKYTWQLSRYAIFTTLVFLACVWAVIAFKYTTTAHASMFPPVFLHVEWDERETVQRRKDVTYRANEVLRPQAALEFPKVALSEAVDV